MLPCGSCGPSRSAARPSTRARISGRSRLPTRPLGSPRSRLPIGLASALLLFASCGLQAQDAATGSIRGLVKNSRTLEPVPNAKVQIEGEDQSTPAAADGSYRLDGLPAGPIRLNFEAPGFKPRGLTVTVVAGESSRGDVTLAPPREPISVIVVPPPNPDSTELPIAQHRNAPGTTVTIDKDLADAVGGSVESQAKTLPSVTVVGNFLYIRGLGERYGQTLLNFAPMASPEPDRKVVPIDLFPTSIVNFFIETTYSADKPGDFAGGSLQIVSIGVPEESFFEGSLGLKYVDGTTGRDFSSYDGGSFDFLGYDDGTRGLPDEVPRNIAFQGLDDLQIQAVGRSFDNVWNEDNITAPPATSFGFTFGHRLPLTEESEDDEKKGPALGLIGTLDWSNSYQTIDDEVFRIIIQGGGQGASLPVERNKWDIDRYQFKSELSAALNLALRFSDGQVVGLRNLFSHVAEDQYRLTQGEDFSANTPARITNLRWVERTLLVNQAYGEHLVVDDWLFQWRGGYSLSQRDEPDNRKLRYLFDDQVINDFVFDPRAGSGSRDYFQLDENIYDGALDISIPFAPFQDPPSLEDLSAVEIGKVVPDQKIKLGAAITSRDRDFDGRRFRFTTERGSQIDENGNRIDPTGTGEELFRPENIHPDGVAVLDSTLANDNYTAAQLLNSFYALFDIRITQSVQVEAGARFEHSDQELTSFAPLTGEQKDSRLRTDDVLPSLNVRWKFLQDFYESQEWKKLIEDPKRRVWENQVLSFSISQTINRPEFRELAPFEFIDVEGDKVRGIDPDLGESLERAKITNFDLRYELRPNANDLIALGGFYKAFEDPIEYVFEFRGEGRVRKPVNADEATLFGFEFEVRKNLGFIADWLELDYDPWGKRMTDADDLPVTSLERELLEGLRFIGNFSLIESDVSLAPGAASIETNSSRPLQGAPDFIMNLGLIWNIKPWDLTLSVLSNYVGKRLRTAGTFGVPDEIEQPRWSLDASIVKRIGEHHKLKLSFDNILDEPFVIEQSTFTTREYTRGWSIGLSYSFSY